MAMRAALGKAGAPTIHQGDVYLIADSYLHFPDVTPGLRTTHQDRYVLVLQDDTHGYNASCPSVLVALMSSQTQHKRRWEYQLTAGVGGQPHDSLVKVHLIQPVPRKAIEDGTFQGTVPALVLDDILSDV